MNCKLVEHHKTYSAAQLQVFLFLHLATRGPQNVKKMEKQGKNLNNIFHVHNLLT